MERVPRSSAVGRSHTSLRAGLRAPTAPSMPDVVDSMLDCAVCCSPHASPALTSGAGKRQTGPKDHSKSLTSLRKIWSGRRDSNPRPQPWQSYISERIWCGQGNRTRTLREKRIFRTTSASAAARGGSRGVRGLDCPFTMPFRLPQVPPVQSLHLPSNEGLARDRPGARCSPGFPRLERFYAADFPRGHSNSVFKVCCVYQFATSALPYKCHNSLRRAIANLRPVPVLGSCAAPSLDSLNPPSGYRRRISPCFLDGKASRKKVTRRAHKRVFKSLASTGFATSP